MTPERIKDELSALLQPSRWYRVQVAARRALRRGTALYIASVLCFSLGTLALRNMVRELREHYDSFQSETAEVLRAEPFPTPDDRYFGVLSTLFRGASVDAGSDDGGVLELCPDEEDECRRIKVVNDVFFALAEAAARGEDGGAAPEVPELAAMIEKSGLAAPSFVTDVWKEAAARHLDEYAASLGPTNVPATGTQGNDASARARDARTSLDGPGAQLQGCIELDSTDDRSESVHDDDFGPKGCEAAPYRSRFSRVFVSAQENRAVDPKGKFEAGPRITAALQLSRFLDDAVAPFAAKPCADGDGRAFVQAYFISPDNLVRLWSCGEAGEQPAEMFPRTRRWSEAGYFKPLLQGALEKQTTPYIDFGGFGVVATRCRAVLDRTSIDWRRNALLGAFCTDNTLPLSVIVERVGKSKLFRIMRLEATLADGRQFTADTIQLSDLAEATSMSGAAREDLRQDIAAALTGQLSVGAAQFKGSATALLKRTLGQHITKLPLREPHGSEGAVAFFVPLKARGSAALSGLVVIPQIARPQVAWHLVATLAGYGAALAFVLAGSRRARRTSEATVVANLLRNLEVGICIVNERDEIEATNDRAEDVLGLALPKIGEQLRIEGGLQARMVIEDETSSLRFSEIIEETVFVMNSFGVLEQVQYATIQKARSKGESSTYFARLALGESKGKFIRVSGAPVLQSEGAEALAPRTMGIVEQVPWRKEFEPVWPERPRDGGGEKK